MQDKIFWALTLATSSSQAIQITFKNKTIQGVNFLLEMERTGFISIEFTDQAVLRSVVKSGRWLNDTERSVTFLPIKRIHVAEFIARLFQDTETIEVLRNV